MNYNISLIGFMGAGKTTISHELKNTMNIPEVDVDAYIVEKTGMSINNIFAEHGEEHFRQIETECLKEIQQEKGRIVSCGGGAVLKDENVACMKENGVIVLLTAEPETILERVRHSKDRPILNGNMNVEFITELMNKRKDRYTQVADIIVATDKKNVAQIGREIRTKVENFMEKK